MLLNEKKTAFEKQISMSLVSFFFFSTFFTTFNCEYLNLKVIVFTHSFTSDRLGLEIAINLPVYQWKADGKLQNDCLDIKFSRDRRGVFELLYFMESCVTDVTSTADSYFWVRTDILVDGFLKLYFFDSLHFTEENKIYIYYNDPFQKNFSAGRQEMSGYFVLGAYDADKCMGKWSKFEAFADKPFIVSGSFNSGSDNDGGSQTHYHEYWWGYGVTIMGSISQVQYDDVNKRYYSNTDHYHATHTSSSDAYNVDINNHILLPLCKSKELNLVTDNLYALFRDTYGPDGGKVPPEWEYQSEFENCFIRGTHSGILKVVHVPVSLSAHSIPEFFHDNPSGIGQGKNGGRGCAGEHHKHSVGIRFLEEYFNFAIDVGLLTPPLQGLDHENVKPPYQCFPMGKTTATSQNVKSMIVFATVDNIPMGFDLVTDIDGKFLLMSDSFTCSGGTETHEHNHEKRLVETLYAFDDDGSDQDCYTDGVRPSLLFSNVNHNHRLTFDMSSPGNHIPIYKRIYLFERKGNEAVTFTMEEIQPCDDINCEKCDISYICEECKSSFYLHLESCYVTCPDEYYGDQTTIWKCFECSSHCLTCVDDTLCQLCTPGFFLYSNGCVTTCPSGFYEDYSNSPTCSSCGSNCLMCDDASTCTWCEDSPQWYLHNGNCLEPQDCPDGTFPDDSLYPPSCSLCGGNCESCVVSGNCLKCDQGYFLLLSKCNAECPPGYYELIDVCSECEVDCSECQSPQSCQECFSSFYLHNNLCLDNCPDRFFENAAVTPNVCSPCNDDHCLHCVDGQTSCIMCENGMFLYQAGCYLENNCPLETYPNTDVVPNKCSACGGDCDVCVTAGVCTHCSAGFYLNDTSCLRQCPDGYFENDFVIPPSCDNCESNCKHCSSFDDCYECDPGWYLYMSSCLSNCPSETYPNDNVPFPQCSACGGHCKYCSRAGVCTECVSNYYLHDTLCNSNCPEGFFKDVVNMMNVCTECENHCKFCSSQTTCLECDIGYFLLNGDCQFPCPSTYYENTAVSPHVCSPCESNCLDCVNEVGCLECESGFFLLPTDNRCYASCPEGYFSDNKKCSVCPENCAQCLNSTVCEECMVGYYIDPVTGPFCRLGCPIGEWQNEEMLCEPCFENCYMCIDNNTCLQCDQRFFLHEKGDCVKVCPRGFFGNATIEIPTCQSCNKECASCYGLNLCMSCNAGFFLFDTMCRENCPKKKHFENIEDWRCDPCFALCENCNSKNNCSKCENGYFLHFSKGMDSCPAKCPYGFLENKTSNPPKCSIDYALLDDKRRSRNLGVALGVFLPATILFCCVVLTLVSIIFYVCLRVIQKRRRVKYLNGHYMRFDDELSLDGLPQQEIVDKIVAFMDNTLFSINKEDIVLKGEIGDGASCTVYKATWQNKEVAVKLMRMKYVSSAESFRGFQNELKLLVTLTYPHIVRFYGAFFDRKSFSTGFCTELCQGDMKFFLNDYLKRKTHTYPYTEKIRMIFEIASAMKYVHSKNVIHWSTKHAVLNSLILGYRRQMLKNQRLLTLGNLMKFYTHITNRTLMYMAPELFKTSHYTKTVDLFAFGICVWEILNENYSPYGFKDGRMIVNNVTKDENFRPSLENCLAHDWLKVLMRRCWAHDPQSRGSFEEVYETIEKYKKLVVYVRKKSSKACDAIDTIISDFSVGGVREVVGSVLGINLMKKNTSRKNRILLEEKPGGEIVEIVDFRQISKINHESCLIFDDSEGNVAEIISL